MIRHRLLDSLNVLLGAWILASPWLLKHSMVTTPPGGGLSGMWDLWLVGLVVLVTAVAAIYAFRVWEEWINTALGLWLLASPWILGFDTSSALFWNAVVLGALVLWFAGWVLFRYEGQSDDEDSKRGPLEVQPRRH